MCECNEQHIVERQRVLARDNTSTWTRNEYMYDRNKQQRVYEQNNK
jgi:hypothetical protein